MTAEPTDNVNVEEQDASNSERILFFPDVCTRANGDACTRCMTVCPTGAIRFDDEQTVVIDADSCTLCGICIGICDGFGSNRVTTFDLAKRMVRKAEGSGTLYLCCKEDVFESLEPADNVIVLGCLSAISPEFLTYVLSTGINVVLCHDLAYCESCERGGAFGGKLWQRAFKLAETWTNRELSSADIIPEKETLVEKLAAPDRRALFTGAVGALGEVASGQYREQKMTVVEQFLARQERMRAELAAKPDAGMYLDEESRVSAQQRHEARRMLLEEAVRNDAAISSRIPPQPERNER